MYSESPGQANADFVLRPRTTSEHERPLAAASERKQSVRHSRVTWDASEISTRSTPRTGSSRPSIGPSQVGAV